MATETRPPRTETDEDLLSRSPAHDGVATQRDLREMERHLVAIFDDRLDNAEGRMNTQFGRLNAKIDRLTWIIIVGFSVVSALALAIALRI